MVWAVEHPGSVRTRFEQLHYWLALGQYDKVDELILQYAERRKDDASMFAFRFFVESCFKGAEKTIGGSLERLREIAPDARFEFASLEALRALTRRLDKKTCTHTADQVIQIIDLYLANEKFAANSLTREGLYQAKAKVYRKLGDLDKTIRALDEAFVASNKYHYRVEQAMLLASAGLYEEALGFIDKARDAPKRSWFEPIWRDPDIDRAEAAIRYWQRHDTESAGEGQNGRQGAGRNPSVSENP